MKCPNCDKEMLGGKYCSECRAELLPDGSGNVAPNEGWTESLVERTANRTVEVLTAKQKREREQQLQEERQAQENGNTGTAKRIEEQTEVTEVTNRFTGKTRKRSK
jgi:hypothetical protein